MRRFARFSLSLTIPVLILAILLSLGSALAAAGRPPASQASLATGSTEPEEPQPQFTINTQAGSSFDYLLPATSELRQDDTEEALERDMRQQSERQIQQNLRLQQQQMEQPQPQIYLKQPVIDERSLATLWQADKEHNLAAVVRSDHLAPASTAKQIKSPIEQPEAIEDAALQITLSTLHRNMSDLGFSSSFVITNTSTAAADVAANYFWFNGDYEASQNYTLASGGAHYENLENSSFLPDYFVGYVVASSNELIDGNILTPPYGMIIGPVYEDDGVTPLPDMHVEVHRFSDHSYVSGVNTRSNGLFYLGGLPDGDYFVMANGSDVWAKQWYQNKTRVADADLININAAEVVSDTHFIMQPAATISGTVYAADGVTPLENVNVDLEQGWFGTCTDADGNYTLSSVPYGSHYVVAGRSWNWCTNSSSLYIQEYYNQSISFEDATAVTVDAVSPNVGNIDFTLQPGGTISGRVTDAQTGMPMENVHVNLEEYDTKWYRGDAWTDSDGEYTISGLPDASYRVSIEDSNGLPAGYAREYYSNRRFWHHADPVAISGGSTVNNINFALEKGGSIAGTVYAADGVTPLVNMNVDLSDGGYGTCTDSNGNYLIWGVTLGEHVVAAAPDDNWCEGGADNYLQEYYQEAEQHDQATPVVLSEADYTAEGIDFTLEPGGTINGRVTDAATGLPLADVHVAASVYDGETDWRNDYTDADGYYSLQGLRDGDYRVRIDDSYGIPLGYSIEFYNNTIYWDRADRVNVSGGGTVDDIDFALEEGGGITGTVYAADGVTPLANINVDAHIPDGLGIGNCTDSNGNFRLYGAPFGEYEISAGGGWNYCLNEPGTYARQYYDHVSRNYDATLVSVNSPTTPASGIDFTLQPGGYISGHVEDEDGDPVANLTMVAHLPQPDCPWCNNWIENGETDANGDYRIGPLAEEAFAVQACTDCTGILLVPEYYSDVFQISDATLVNVTSGATTSNIDMSLETGIWITGKVNVPAGYSAQDIQIDVWQWDSNYGSWGRTDADGDYIVPVPPMYDHYWAVAARPWGTDLGSQWAHGFDLSLDTNWDFDLGPGATISGCVTNGAAPVAYAWINADSDWMGQGNHAGADGCYEVTNLPLGDYRVRAENWPDYKYMYYGSFEWDWATVVRLAEGGSQGGIDIELPLMGQLEGHVYESDGVTPMENVHVVAFNDSGFWQAWTQTTGYYTIDLPASDVKVLYERFETNSHEVSFYPVGHWVRDAAWVTVPPYASGPRVINMNLRLLANLSGQVTDADSGAPLGGIHVVAQPVDLSYVGEAGWWQCTDENGHYELPGILPIEVEVTAVGTCYNTSYGEVTQNITLTPGGNHSLNFSLHAGAVPEMPFTIHTIYSQDYTPFSSGYELYMTDADQILPALHTPLTQIDDNGEWYTELLEELPTLANGGAQVVSDQLVVTYTLKPGLLWSDGAALTSTDIRFTWDALTQPRPFFDTYFAQVAAAWKIERIETPDTLTAVAYYKPGEFPSNYLGAILYLMPEHVLAGEHVLDIPWVSHYAHYPVGNGPYVVTEWLPGSHLTLHANPNYHKRSLGLPAIQDVRFQFNDHPFWSLPYGDTHVSLGITVDDVPDDYETYDLNYQLRTANGYEAIILNPELPFFQDINVRRALSHAMNRQAMHDAMGFIDDLATQSYIPRDNPMYSDAYTRYNFNLTTAASLLTTAGWVDHNANGTRDKAGVELEFDVAYREGQDFRRDAAAVYQADLASIGVDLNIVSQPWDTFWNRAKRGAFDSYYVGWWFDGRFEPHGYDIAHSDRYPTGYNTYNLWGVLSWGDAANDALMVAMRSELDAAALKDLYEQHIDLISEAVPALVARTFGRLDAARPTVLNFSPGGNIPSTWNMEYWTVPPNPYDLAVRKALAADSPAPRPGTTIEYSVSVFNNGYFPMTNAVLLDTLPGNVTFHSADPAPDTIDGNKLYWDLGDLAHGATWTVRVSVDLPGTLVHGDLITNNVQVYADQVDTRPENNGFVHTAEVREDVDLTVNKYGVGEPAVGEKYDYYISYANWGGAPTANTVVTDTLPPEVTFMSADPAPSSINGQELTWNLPALPGNQWGGQIQVETEITDAGTAVTNMAEVDSPASEANTLNNSDTHVESVDDILAPVILRPTSGTTDSTPTVRGLAPSGSTVEIYDLSPLQAAALRSAQAQNEPYTADATLIVSTTALGDGTFSVTTPALSAGAHILAATASKSGLTSGYSNTTTIVVVLNLPLDPDHVTITAQGVDISGGSVRAERRALAHAQLELSAILPCATAPTATLDITENGIFEYSIPPVSTVEDSPGNWEVEIQAWLGDPRSSYEIWLRWDCDGVDHEELLVYILIDPDGYLYDQNLVDSGALITDSLILNGMITAYVKTGDDWLVWPADYYGQTNPQSTDGATDDGVLIPGYYSFLTPGGQYRIEASAPGYQPYQSPVLTVITAPIHLDIGMAPVMGGTGEVLAPTNLGTSYKTVDKGSAFRGDILTYDIYLVNNGGSDSGLMTLEDAIPDYTAFVNGSLTWMGGGNASYNPLTGQITWVGSLAAGVEVHIQYQLEVAAIPYRPTQIANVATLEGAPEDIQSVPELAAYTTIESGESLYIPLFSKKRAP